MRNSRANSHCLYPRMLKAERRFTSIHFPQGLHEVLVRGVPLCRGQEGETKLGCLFGLSVSCYVFSEALWNFQASRTLGWPSPVLLERKGPRLPLGAYRGESPCQQMQSGEYLHLTVERDNPWLTGRSPLSWLAELTRVLLFSIQHREHPCKLV